ncbi:sirohydrochlorin cobaltochelatase [Desulfocastanea catecholica]
MKIPIIMSAFGTTSKAVATYTRLDTALRHHFPGTEIIWAYSSRMITRELHQRQESTVEHPAEVLRRLAAEGVRAVIMQSLHLFPGTEFHGLLRIAGTSPLNCTVGKPLLTSPEDYQQVGEILRPVIAERPQKAILVLGHGTDHPIWTAYYTLEKILRKKFGERIFVGVVEKFPDSAHLVEEIANRGFTRVCILPLFLVAGMHYRRDIISDSPSSWRSRLQRRNIAVESLDYGLGLYPGLEELIIRHIVVARKSIDNR